ncbi:MAG: glutathione S-transferase family protein [Alphaproteobacteria bacterium]|nr:glutathione S-transferase family protein [Alphaproteobacteria bacterium]
MITLYSKATSNGRKASIMLEETGLSYRVRAMDLDAREQKEPWFIALNPQGRIPVIVDDDGPDGRSATVFESGAILIYLAEKSGRFLPVDGRARADVLKWLMYASTHLTFTGMQVHWQVRLRDEGRPHDLLSVWQEENNRVYGAFEQGLADGRPFLAGDAYSIADIAAFPWIHRWKMQEITLEDFPAVGAWYARVGARDAVRRGLDVPPRGDAL